jgi:hypothetical protein
MQKTEMGHQLTAVGVPLFWLCVALGGVQTLSAGYSPTVTG